MEKRYFNVVCEELGIFGGKIIHVDKNVKDMNDVHKIVCDTPQSYERTYNFMKILDSTRTRGKGNILRFSVDSGAMDSYVGWFGQSLQPSTAFDYMFMDGEHGHGKWMMHQSLPPYMYVERDIESGFGGRLDKIVNNRIDQILRK